MEIEMNNTESMAVGLTLGIALTGIMAWTIHWFSNITIPKVVGSSTFLLIVFIIMFATLGNYDKKNVKVKVKEGSFKDLIDSY